MADGNQEKAIASGLRQTPSSSNSDADEVTKGTGAVEKSPDKFENIVVLDDGSDIGDVEERATHFSSSHGKAWDDKQGKKAEQDEQERISEPTFRRGGVQPEQARASSADPWSPQLPSNSDSEQTANPATRKSKARENDSLEHEDNAVKFRRESRGTKVPTGKTGRESGEPCAQDSLTGVYATRDGCHASMQPPFRSDTRQEEPKASPQFAANSSRPFVPLGVSAPSRDTSSSSDPLVGHRIQVPRAEACCMLLTASWQILEDTASECWRNVKVFVWCVVASTPELDGFQVSAYFRQTGLHEIEYLDRPGRRVAKDLSDVCGVSVRSTF
eukprot:384540-Hanusia_phi.AAC.2